MLRRVARVLRVGLLALGMGLSLWIPFSFYWTALVRFPPPLKGYGVFCNVGEVHLFSFRSEFWHEAALTTPTARIRTQGLYPFWHPGLVWVRVENTPGERMMFISIPLWLLAFICLAWPVTSLVIARWRHKRRGFEVEATGVKSIDG